MTDGGAARLSRRGRVVAFVVGCSAVASIAALLQWGDTTVRLGTVAALTIGLSLFDIMGRAAYAAFMNAAIISVCALVLVAVLASLRLRAVA